MTAEELCARYYGKRCAGKAFDQWHEGYLIGGVRYIPKGEGFIVFGKWHELQEGWYFRLYCTESDLREGVDSYWIHSEDVRID